MVILQNFEEGCREKLEEPRGARNSKSLIKAFARIITY